MRQSLGQAYGAYPSTCPNDYSNDYSHNDYSNEGMQDGIYTVARNMKQMGLPIADIAKAAGLSEKEITKL